MWRARFSSSLQQKAPLPLRQRGGGRTKEKWLGLVCLSKDLWGMDINKHKSLLHSLFSAKRSVLMDKGWFSGLPIILMRGRFTVARLRRIYTGLALFERLYVFSRRHHLCRGAAIQFWLECGANAPDSSIIFSTTGGVQGYEGTT